MAFKTVDFYLEGKKGGKEGSSPQFIMAVAS